MREAFEEAGIPLNSKYRSLNSRSTHSVVDVVGYFMWGPDTFVIPEYCFGVELDEMDLSLSMSTQNINGWLMKKLVKYLNGIVIE